MTVFLRATCDETGIDSNHEFAIACGCIGQEREWGAIESEWNKRLQHENVKYFHALDFNKPNFPYKNWSLPRRKKFYRYLSDVVDKSPIYQVAIAVDKKEHKKLKDEMKGTKRFKQYSDYGLAFQLFVTYMCDSAIAGYGDDVKINFIIEDGPYTSGIQEIYKDLRNGSLASALGTLTTARKDDLIRGVEIADYLADRALTRIKSGLFRTEETDMRHSFIAGEKFLKGVLGVLQEENQKRKDYWHNSSRIASD